MRSQREIEDQLGEASAWGCEGKTDVPGMSYEEGVEAALNWVLGNTDDKPVENSVEEACQEEFE